VIADALEARVAAFLKALDGRAAGLWRVRGDRLILVAFLPAPGLDPEVAAGFAAATAEVALARVEFSIVLAATTGAPAVIEVDDESAVAGSRLWLRRLGADRSVALPLRAGADFPVGGVLSIALRGDDPGPVGVAAAARAQGFDAAG